MVEDYIVAILVAVRQAVIMMVAVKRSPYARAPGDQAVRTTATGAGSLVLLDRLV